MFGQQQPTAVPNTNPNNDYAVPGSPTDGISSLSWSPDSRFLVSGSWDQSVRCYEVAMQQQLNVAQRAQTNFDGPVLCTDFSADGAVVFAGGCDQMARSWTLQTQQATVIGRHEAPISSIHCVRDFNLVITGGWDNTIQCSESVSFLFGPSSVSFSKLGSMARHSISFFEDFFIFFIFWWFRIFFGFIYFFFRGDLINFATQVGIRDHRRPQRH